MAISRINVCARWLSFQNSGADERDSISWMRFDFVARSKSLLQAGDAPRGAFEPVFQ
jgi:hypothetical protein